MSGILRRLIERWEPEQFQELKMEVNEERHNPRLTNYWFNDANLWKQLCIEWCKDTISCGLNYWYYGIWFTHHWYFNIKYLFRFFRYFWLILWFSIMPYLLILRDDFLLISLFPSLTVVSNLVPYKALQGSSWPFSLLNHIFMIITFKEALCLIPFYSFPHSTYYLQQHWSLLLLKQSRKTSISAVSSSTPPHHKVFPWPFRQKAQLPFSCLALYLPETDNPP